MANVGFGTFSVIPSFDGFGRKLEQGTSGPLAAAGAAGGTRFGDAAGKSAGSRFGSIFKKAAKGALLGLAGAGALAVKFGGDAVSAASDLSESTNKVAVIFGDASDKVLKFTETTADAFGQSNNQAREAASTFGTFGKAAGFADAKNARFAKRMTKLASDLASFNNTEPDQAVEALGAALRGEAEPIRAYGVLLDEATLKAEAMRLGILKPVKDKSKIIAYQVRITELQKDYNEAVKEHGEKSLEALKVEASLGTARTQLQKATEGTIPPLTQQQKLLAAQSEIFKQTSDAQGDFARTSDGLANQQRRLSARFEDAKAKLGQGLLPIMSDAADFLLDKGIPAFEDFSGWFNKKGLPALEDFAGFLGDEVVPKLKKAGDLGRDFVDAFKDMPDWARDAIVTGTLGGIAAKKLGILGGKGGGIFSKGATPARPLYVNVVNGGFGPGVSTDSGNPKRRGRRGSTAADLAILFGIPLAADLGAGVLNKTLGGRESTAGDLSREDRFLEKWGQTTEDAIQDAFGGLAARTGEPRGGTLPGGRGINIPFVNVPGVDFFNNTKGVQEKLDDLTGGQLLELNKQIKRTYGVGLPALAKEGFVSASTVAKLELTKQIVEFQRVKSNANDYFMFVKGHAPREIHTTVTGWDLAKKDAREYIALLLEARSIHIDTRLDRLAPTPVPTGGGNRASGGKGGSGPSGRGVAVIINGDVRPNDSKQFFGDLQRRAVGSFSTGGW